MSPTKLTQIYEELKDEVRRGELRPGAVERDGMAAHEAKSRDLGRNNQTQAPNKALNARELEVRALAERIFGDENKADAWLRRPNASLSGQIPIDLLKDELGAAVVRETLEQIDHGIFA